MEWGEGEGGCGEGREGQRGWEGVWVWDGQGSWNWGGWNEGGSGDWGRNDGVDAHDEFPGVR